MDQDDLSFIMNKDAKTYCSMQKPNEEQTKAFEEEVAQEDENMASLLTSMIEFNPFFRASPAECLKNPFFDPIRVPQLEQPAA